MELLIGSENKTLQIIKAHSSSLNAGFAWLALILWEVYDQQLYEFSKHCQWSPRKGIYIDLKSLQILQHSICDQFTAP
jgi:hypothetical protein